jgi:type II secretory ATPase GspE/PulE/Tfp pilus assembly ATPase PilB-like protein
MTRTLRGKTIKIESIEDPVEYLIEGASQMAVSSRVNFGELLKATLRHDPDVLMVGEIRDRESATTIESMVLAGRKVFATLHAFEALAVPQRLMKIGVTEDVLYMNNFLSGVIYQRLLPVLCPHCSIPWTAAVQKKLVNEDLVGRVHQPIPDYSLIRVHNSVGCEHCRGRAPGYKGRTVVAEIVRPDDAMLSHLRSGNQQLVREYWLDSPSDTGFGVTALGHALSLMVKGIVGPLDVESQVGIIQARRVSTLNEKSGGLP